MIGIVFKENFHKVVIASQKYLIKDSEKFYFAVHGRDRGYCIP